MKFYLIQRCHWGSAFDDKAGFDANICLDYMGSSEFEFGALPKSLRAIVAKLDTLQWFKHPTLPRLKYLHHERSDQIEQFLTDKAADEYCSPRLKERMRLADMIANDKYDAWRTINIWWDIENHFLVVDTKHITKATGRMDIVLKNVKKKFAAKVE